MRAQDAHASIAALADAPLAWPCPAWLRPRAPARAAPSDGGGPPACDAGAAVRTGSEEAGSASEARSGGVAGGCGVRREMRSSSPEAPRSQEAPIVAAGRAHAGAAAAGRQVDRQSINGNDGGGVGSPVSSSSSLSSGGSVGGGGGGSDGGSLQTSNRAEAPEPHGTGGSGTSSGASSSGASGGSGGLLVGGGACALHAQLDALFAGGGALGREGAMALLERRRRAAASPARAAHDSAGACPGSSRATAGCGRGRRGGRGAAGGPARPVEYEQRHPGAPPLAPRGRSVGQRNPVAVRRGSALVPVEEYLDGATTATRGAAGAPGVAGGYPNLCVWV